jgi:hypothetical protein
MPLAFNNDTKALEHVPGEKLGDAFLSGTHNLPAGKPVTLADSSGSLVDVDPSEAYKAVTQHGYRFAGDNEIQDADNQQTYGEGLGNAAKAFGAGALRSASFGVSDQLATKTGLVSPETLYNLKKYNPGSTLAGEAAGIIGSIAAPEIEGLGALGSVANPVKAISRLGEGIEGATAGALGTNAVTSTAQRILGGAASKFAGSAVEGAAYGAGESVSEDALGDPLLNAQKVISNIGMSALLGGSIGTALGMTLGSKASRFVSETDKPALEAGDLGAAVKASDGFTEGEREGILADLTKQKTNSSEIQQAADVLGAPLIPGQLAKSDLVQRGASMLINGPPTFSSIRVQKLYWQGMDAVEKTIQDALGGAQQMSEAEVGQSLRQGISNKIQEMQKPIQEAYQSLGADQAQIPIAETAVQKTQKTLQAIEGISQRPSSAEATYLKGVVTDLENVKTVEDLRRFTSSVGRETAGNPAFRYVGGQVRDALNELEESSVLGHAKDMAAPIPEAQAAVEGLLKRHADAKAAYAQLRGKMEWLGEALGKRKIYGPQHFLDVIADMPAEKLTKKLFTKGDSAFVDFFQKEFPQEFETLRNFERGKILQKATKGGELRYTAAFKEVDGLSKEIRQSLFTPDELQKLSAAKTYIEAIPKDANPSKTSHAGAFRDFFHSPTGATIANARDFGIEQFIKGTSRFADNNVQALGAIERASRKTTARIASGAKAVFKYGYQGAPAIAVESSFLGKHSDDRKANQERSEKQYFKRADHIGTLAANPDRFLNTLDSATMPVFPHAPKIASQLQQSAVKGIQFLASKRPGPGQQMPLSPKYIPAQSEISQFNHYYDLVEDPIRALDELKTGTLQPSTIETLQAVYPELYGEMQSQIVHEITNRNNEVPYRQKVLLSMFLGSDLDESLLTQNMQANQATLQGPSQQANNQPAAPKVNQKALAEIDRSSQVTTAMQKTAQREA